MVLCVSVKSQIPSKQSLTYTFKSEFCVSTVFQVYIFILIKLKPQKTTSSITSSYPCYTSETAHHSEAVCVLLAIHIVWRTLLSWKLKKYS